MACCHLEPLANGRLEFADLDRRASSSAPPARPRIRWRTVHPQKAIYNRIVRQFTAARPSRSGLSTNSDAPVRLRPRAPRPRWSWPLLQAWVEWLKLPLGEYDVAQLAYQIEREDAALLGGRQDQYAAPFGGFNFMEFYADNRVIGNPLRIKEAI